MTKPADIWMPLYVEDYLRDTLRLTAEQHGAYMLLIMDYWIKGPPPDDDQVLATIVKASKKEWQKLRKILSGFFVLDEGVWRHKRIDLELTRANAIIEQRQAAGRASAQARANKRANGEANETPTSVATGEPTERPTKRQRNGRPLPSPKGETKEPSKKVKLLKGDLGVAALPCARAREGPAETPQPVPAAAGPPPPSVTEITEVETLCQQAIAALRGDVPKGVRDAAAYQAAIKANKFTRLVKTMNAWASTGLHGEEQWAAWEVLAAAEEAGARSGMNRARRRDFDTLVRIYRATEPVIDGLEVAA